MTRLSESELWKQIDASESYLVCCMFEEAASQAASIVQHIRTATEAIGETQLAEMMESAGMVFVQSSKELGRTSELFVELQMLFGSVAAIPVQVFLTGACMQISEGLSSNLKAIFEEFLGKWTYLEGEVYVLPKAKPQSFSSEGYIRKSVMHAEKYMEVAEVYAITFLGMVLRNPDLAISWTERAELPEEKRQDMLRRLHSLHFATEASSSLGPGTIQMTERIVDPTASGNGSTLSVREGFPRTIKPPCHPNGEKSKPTTSKSILPTIERISDRFDPYFRWFRTVHLKYGNVQLVLPRGKTMLLGLLMFFTYYIIRKRTAALKRVVSGQASSIKRALIDAWQLAFSVNVNPLAAVQQLPSAPRGSR